MNYRPKWKKIRQRDNQISAYITLSKNFAKGSPHEKCTRKVQMQRTEELLANKEILKKYK